MNNEISQRILSLVNSGVSLKEAVDAVLGAGTFMKIASDVYDSICYIHSAIKHVGKCKACGCYTYVSGAERMAKGGVISCRSGCWSLVTKKPVRVLVSEVH